MPTVQTDFYPKKNSLSDLFNPTNIQCCYLQMGKDFTFCSNL